MTEEATDEVEQSAAPLIEHLAELRTRLLYCVYGLIAGILITFGFAEFILDFLLMPVSKVMQSYGIEPEFQFLSPQEKFFALFRISFVAGFMVAFPVIAYQMWRFVAPGLYRNEKGAFLPFIVASPLLFLTGAAFAHYVVSPLAMRFFVGFADALPTLADAVSSGDSIVETAREVDPRHKFEPSIQATLDIVLKFIFAFGICFQLPVLLTLMGMADLVSSDGLKNTRKYAVVGILVLAAVVTPPDVVTQVILFSVVYLLYEVSIWLVIMVERRRNERLAAEGYFDDEDLDE